MPPMFKSSKNEENQQRKHRKFIARFLDNEAEKGIIPKVSAQYDPHTATYIPQSGTQSPDQSPALKPDDAVDLPGNDDLREALRRIKDLNLKPRLDIDVDTCSWEDVFLQMNDANGRHEARAKGFKGSLIKIWRAMGKNADDTTPFFDLIPGEKGLDILKAGLTICFQLAKKSFDKKAKIVGTFEDIPFVVMRAQVMRRNFPEDEELKNRCIQVYGTILASIADLIGYLLPDIEAKKILFFFNKRPSSGQIDDTLDRVKTAAEDLERLTKTRWEELLVHIKQRTDEIYDETAAHHKLGKETNSRVRKVESGVSFTRKAALQANKQLTSLQRTSDKINQRSERTFDSVTGIGQNVNHIKETGDKNHTLLEITYRDIQDLKAIAAHNRPEKALRSSDDCRTRNAFLQYFSEDRIVALVEKGLKEESRSQESNSRAFITIELLIKYMAVGRIQPRQDLEYIFRESHDFTAISMGQAHSLLSTDQFRQWSLPQRPSILLVNGNLKLAGSERMSAMSFMCASLAAGLGEVQKDAVIIHFFCGLHTASDDELTGPNGMMRSLIWQMILALDSRKLLSLEFVNTRPFREALEARDLPHLIYTFQRLVAELLLDTHVYCILDGIDWYEEYDFEYDLKAVVYGLRDLALNDQLHAVFKLLMTSANQSRSVAEILGLSREQCVSLREDLSDSDVVWKRKMEQDTEHLGRKGVSYAGVSNGWDSGDENGAPENSPYT
ncbi:hypothetical protein GQ43DRAFT_441757 [Delitschia confertaspora ATCC 74209]|uniref:Nephrocystin 3-like N-terminal domain-containing protein n=1 Tax=Delitschia confertaspora ATCC 74209 TaxID=1513339 RepID=A0A9P4JIZ4_9PLEO|nr:hypothetical protein GQ43DRAFT_441757 [Delitschia confertaspora ATCC 74209]